MRSYNQFTGSVQQYLGQLADPDQHSPRSLRVSGKHPLTAHGFYSRTIVDAAFDGLIACDATSARLPPHRSLLPSSPCLLTFQRSPYRPVLVRPTAPGENSRRTRCRHRAYQRGQFWMRRFARKRGLVRRAGRVTKPAPAPTSFIARIAKGLEIVPAGFSATLLFAGVRQHLLAAAFARSDGAAPRSPPAAANA